jgi:hypothetical protein
MKIAILSAAFAMLAFAGIAVAQARTCYQTCTPTYGGGYNCTTQCF